MYAEANLETEKAKARARAILVVVKVRDLEKVERDLEIRDLEKVRDLERDLEMVTVLGLSVTTAVRKDIMQMFAGIHSTV